MKGCNDVSYNLHYLLLNSVRSSGTTQNVYIYMISQLA